MTLDVAVEGSLQVAVARFAADGVVGLQVEVTVQTSVTRARRHPILAPALTTNLQRTWTSQRNEQLPLGRVWFVS